MSKHRRVDLSDFRVKPGENIHMGKIKTDDVGDWDEESAMHRLEKNRQKIIELQDTLYAEGKQSLLVVLQAMDAAGKDSTIKAVTQGINPQGCSVVSFKQPSSEELSHDFLWRIHQETPAKGKIGIFNRSHYEDVIITRVHELIDKELIKKRYDHINDFERMLTDHGVKIVKKALQAPCKRIVDNAGYEGSVVVENLLNQKDCKIGYNAYDNSYQNMEQAGILDPTKVVRTALVDAASIASLMITTETAIVDTEKAPPMGP